MNKNFFIIMGLGITTSLFTHENLVEKMIPTNTKINADNTHGIHTKVCDNGLTIIVRQTTHASPVSVRMSVNVGSVHEKEGEKGLAHLLEHMVFKGTEGAVTLSENDMGALATKLGANVNAHTTWDSTTYLFDVPVRHWQEVLPVLAACLNDCTFKQDLLNAEFKAVLQELKMRRDKYSLALFEEMLTNIFTGHPYHYPIIGYKEDIWNVMSADLHRFYKKHYMPNNAVVVVVGNVDPEDAIRTVESAFKHISAGTLPERAMNHYTRTIGSKSSTIYRDVKQSQAVLMATIPGLSEKNMIYVADVAANLLGGGAGSRLYQRLREKEKLVHSISCDTMHLSEHGVLYVWFEPCDETKIDTIAAVINEEITLLATNGPDDMELRMVTQDSKVALYRLMENNGSQAEEIGKLYLATRDPYHLFNLFACDQTQLKSAVQAFLQEYCRPTMMHRGALLPMNELDKPLWQKLQAHSDMQDEAILKDRIRTSAVEEPLYALTVTPCKQETASYPKPTEYTLDNGIRVLQYHNTNVPTITMGMHLKARCKHDSESKPGLYNFTTTIMSQGTTTYTKKQLADISTLCGAGMTINFGNVTCTTLSETAQESFTLFMDILKNPRFDNQDIELTRAQLLKSIKQVWDDPGYIAGRIARQQVYPGHARSKDLLGTVESITSITREDLVAFHKEHISPDGAVIAIVGDFTGLDIRMLLNKTFGSWQGPTVKSVEHSTLQEVKGGEIRHPLNRDQVTLMWSGQSVKRNDPDFDPLLIFSYIVSLGGLNSRLFKLREETGLFYSARCSMVDYASNQPGMICIQTQVSVQQLEHAEKAITHLLDTVIDTLTPEEVEEAKAYLLDGVVSGYSTSMNIANTFLSLNKYAFAFDYYDKRPQSLGAITLNDVKKAAKKWLKREKLITIKVGRV